MPKIRVFDFETTGFPPGAKVVEVGFTDLGWVPETKQYFISPTRSMLCDPSPAMMNVEALATHHITPDMYKGAPPSDTVLQELEIDALNQGINYWAAHNAKFDLNFFKPSQPVLCTLKTALQAVPQAPKHTNQVLRYFLKLNLEPEKCEPSHRAGPDTYVTAHILLHFLMQGITLEQMNAWSNQASLLPMCSFGEHKGKKWEDVPSQYLRWIVGNTKYNDENVKFTARHHLKLRGMAF